MRHPESESSNSGILIDSNDTSSNVVPIMAETLPKTVKVAAVQAEPAWNDLQGGVAKTISLIKQAASEGANVLGFPEVFIPGYPWSVSQTPV